MLDNNDGDLSSKKGTESTEPTMEFAQEGEPESFSSIKEGSDDSEQVLKSQEAHVREIESKRTFDRPDYESVSTQIVENTTYRKRDSRDEESSVDEEKTHEAK